ncbi:MAG: outer membrane protein transport protein [Ignavibacterium sp.]|nr:outer membrane protein transport protein [Ignavibacterium sp.]
MKRLLLVFIVVFSVYSINVFAGGFQQNQHGARAKALGGAFTALANDPSAIYWNGAGLTQLSGTKLMLGTHLLFPASSFRGVAPSKQYSFMESQMFTPTHLFASHNFDNGLAIGLGFTQPYGSGTKWSEDWIGRYITTETKLQTFILMPTVAYELFDGFSLSAAFIYSFANVLIERMIPQYPFEGDANISLEGDDSFAYGYNFGLLYKPTEWLSIGGSFRSEVEYGFEGTATTTGAVQLIDRFPKGDISANLTTPMNIVGGLAVNVTDELTLSADYQWVGWSSYDELAVDFADDNYPDASSPRDYQDSYIIRFGAQYDMLDEFSAMAGIYYDNMPVATERLNPSLPDANRLGFSLGFIARLTKNFSVTGAFMYLRGEQTSVTDSKENYYPVTGSFVPFNGTYNSTAKILSMSLQYDF